MIQYSEQISLQKYNTFGIDVRASRFFSYSEVEELQSFIQKGFDTSLPFFILGGGSNVLFLNDYDGTVIHPQNVGITIIAQTESFVRVQVGAGENWDNFVAWAVGQNLYGVENLSHIPGSVGASAVQNIGAYGSEVSSVIFEVHTIDLRNGTTYVYSNQQCDYAYRSSLFKQIHMKSQVITQVVYTLQKQGECNVSYGSLQREIEARGEVNLHSVRQAIIATRNQKLPNPDEIGNAGSFFKNPVISKQQFISLQQAYPSIVWFTADNDSVKIAAGWLIDALGLKGYSLGNAQVHPKQALVLTNIGGATGKDIKQLAEYIQQKVFLATGIELEPEVIYLS